MAEPSALTLLAPTALVASANGDAVAISGRQRLGVFTVDVSAYSGTSLVVALQRRPDTLAQWEATATLTVTAVGSYELAGAVGALTRVVLTLSSATATVGVRGTAHTVYAEERDVTDLVCKAAAIQELSDAKVAASLIAATAEADGYLRGGYTFPLVSWDADLRKHTAALAAAAMFGARGANPDGPDALVFNAQNKAIAWFVAVQAGRLQPNIVDSTPEVYEQGIAIYSRTRRNW